MTNDTKTERLTAHDLGIQPGDFFEGSWGYDQTNVDFWIVRAVSSTGKTVQVQRVAVVPEYTESTDHTTDKIRATYKGTGDVKRKTLHIWDDNAHRPRAEEPRWIAGFSDGHYAGAPHPTWAGPGVVPSASQTAWGYGH